MTARPARATSTRRSSGPAAGNLPVVFFCQNNQWAISEPVDRQSRVPLYQRARGFGFPGVRVDGNDVLACLAVTRKALDDARNAQGPTLIEAFTYRMNPHTTSDDPTRYRLGGEAETWKLKDPIERVRAYLTREAKLDPEFFDEVEREVAAAGRAHPRRLPRAAEPEPGVAVRPTCTSTCPTSCASSATSSSTSSHSVEEVGMMTSPDPPRR